VQPASRIDVIQHTACFVGPQPSGERIAIAPERIAYRQHVWLRTRLLFGDRLADRIDNGSSNDTERE
jgi:hypothetical protein